MSDVTGPISTLPGSKHVVPEGMMCDTHADRPATKRIQGETDSMGCEMIDCCDECATEITKYDASPKAHTGCCDWCKSHATDLRDHRDFEEGLSGRIYRVCGECRRKEMEHINEEYEENHRHEADDWTLDHDDNYEDHYR